MLKIAIGRVVPFRLMANAGNPVLTLHACFRVLPPNVSPLDNHHPEALYEHLRQLSAHFRFVAIDELCDSRRVRGLASLTFDDGYQSVLSEALPVLESLNIPATIFINSASLEGKVFWRHKLLHALTRGFQTQLDGRAGQDLYRLWKLPQINSKRAEAAIDAILSQAGAELENHLFNQRACLVGHRLLTYGNHSHNHYVLSSLSREEQFEEIDRCRQALNAIPGIARSAMFSLPFGETHHANDDTFDAVRDLGYRAILMNRGGLNPVKLSHYRGLQVIERFSPAHDSIRWSLLRERLRSFQRPEGLEFAHCAEGNPSYAAF